MDPALSYTQEGWTALWNVYTPLLTYKHAEGAEGATLIPGLAEAMPEISPDGKTYKLKLRPGLKFSDGTPVKASDFEHTIKRVLNLESGGSAFYLPIVGAEDYVKAGKPDADIPGIVTNDKTREITIKLNSQVGSFSNVLAMDFAGIVPGDTPFKNLTADPPPGVGPYKLTSSVPNRGFTMVKNDQFPGLTSRKSRPGTWMRSTSRSSRTSSARSTTSCRTRSTSCRIPRRRTACARWPTRRRAGSSPT